jgi:hypothetical protein
MLQVEAIVEGLSTLNLANERLRAEVVLCKL